MKISYVKTFLFGKLSYLEEFLIWKNSLCIKEFLYWVQKKEQI